MVKTIIINGVKIEGEYIKVNNNGSIIVDDHILDIPRTSIINITGDVHRLDAGGSVNVKGNVYEIGAGGSVACGNVQGDIDCGGSVTAKNVKGDIDAGGNVMVQNER